METEEIVKRAKANDAAALAMLVEAYSPRVRAVCFGITREDEDTLNDLVQMVFIRAFYSLHQLRDASKFGEWVCAIARNEALKYLRHKQQGRLVPFSSLTDEEWDVASGVTPENELEEKELHEIVGLLPAGYGKVFRMAVLEGYSHKEIAERLGIEPHSSSSQLARAKAMLRKMINKRMLAIVSIVLIGIPLYRLLWRKHRAEDETTHTAQVKNERKGEPKWIERQTEEKSTRKDVSTNVPTNATYAHVAPPPMPDSLCALDTLQLPSLETDRLIAEIATDRAVTDTTRTLWPESDTPYVAEATALPPKHRWQLLAAGSLGSALAQSAYKMLAGQTGLPDADAPPIPNEFGTWEECYRYLQTKAPEGLTEEEKALMQIALNNKNNLNNNLKNDGKIVEHERHGKPLTFGLSVTKALGNRWSVATGLQYSLLRSEFTLGEDAYYVRRNQKVHYLGIPLHVAYKWVDAKHWSVYSSLGGALHIPVYGKTTERYVVGPATPYATHWHFTPSLQWSVGVSVGVQYRLSPHWGVYMEPTLNGYVPNGSSVHTIWTEHPFSFTMPLGIRFTW